MRGVSPLGIARIGAGTAAALKALALSDLMPRVLDPALISLPVIPFIPRLPPGAAVAWTSAWIVSAIAFAWGWKPRVSGSVLALILWATLGMDQQFYSNHLYLLALVVSILALGAPARGGGDGAPWAVALLMAQVTIVYAYAGLSKLNPSWIAGDVLERYADGLLRMAGDAIPWIYPALAAASIAAELGLAVLLWSRWYRAAWLGGALFHVGCVLLLSWGQAYELLIFSITMVSLYPLFGVRPRVWDNEAAPDVEDRIEVAAV